MHTVCGFFVHSLCLVCVKFRVIGGRSMDFPSMALNFCDLCDNFYDKFCNVLRDGASKG